MNNGTVRKIESHSGIFIVAALGILIIVLFCLLWIRPAMNAIDGLDGRIAELELQKEKQKRLSPVYAQLAGRSTVDVPPGLQVVERTPLPERGIAGIIPRFRELAEESGLRMPSIAPQLATLEAVPGHLAVDAVVEGDFFQFRRFLFALMELPCLEAVESITVRQAGSGAEEKQIAIKLWLSIG